MPNNRSVRSSQGNAAASAFSGKGLGSATRQSGGKGGGSVVLFQGELEALLAGPNGPVAKELTRRALKCVGRAKRLCPVDTGRLRASIAWRMDREGGDLVAIVGTNVKYATFVEFGTRYNRAQPFLRPALQEATR